MSYNISTDIDIKNKILCVENKFVMLGLIDVNITSS